MMCVAVSSIAMGSYNHLTRCFAAYKTRLWPLIGFALALSVFQNSTAIAEDTIQNSVRENLVAFEKLAVSLCQTVPTKSSNEELSLSINGKAELSKLIKVLARLDAEIEFDMESDETTGVLQRDLAKVIIHSNNCRLEALRIVVEFVKSHIGLNLPKPQYENAGENVNLTQDDTRESRVKQIVNALDHMPIYDVADYLLRIIPGISGGIIPTAAS